MFDATTKKNGRQRERRSHAPLRRARKQRSQTVAVTTTPLLLAIAASLGAAASGLDLCAAKTRDPSIAVAAKRESESLKRAAAAITSDAHPPRARMGDRLRWEWLASTGIVMDGGCEVRVLSECARILEGVVIITSTSGDVASDELKARLRVAKLTTSSLLSMIETRNEIAMERLAPT